MNGNSSRHHFAQTDEEEELALSLALAASLEEAGPSASTPHQHQHQHQPPAAGSSRQTPLQQMPPAYPRITPAADRSNQPVWQQQPLPPAASSQLQQQQQQQQQQPYYPQQQPQQQQQQQQGNKQQPLWKNPLKLIDAAVQKADSALQKAVAGDRGSSCAGCGKWLGIGPAVRALGQQWHVDCFRCAGCHQPLTADGLGNTFAVGSDELPYHADCHKRLFHPKCSVCHSFIPNRPDGRTEWRENPYWRNRHCPVHASDGTPQCCSCNRLQPQGDEWVSLQDGRLLCLECLDTLVIDTKDAQPLYNEVLNFFVHMGMPHPYKVPLLLVEGPVLDEYACREGRQQQGSSSALQGQPALPVFHVRGLCVAHVYTTIPSVVRVLSGHGQADVHRVTTRLAPQQQQQQHCSVSVLLVMYGLPRLLVGSIVAHELMHAYLRMRHVTGLPLQVEEGLCQLMALLWLDSQDRWAQRAGPYQEKLLSYLGHQIRTDSSEVYGEGFRIAMENFQKRGLKALVEHIIATGAWPNWHH